ncbi:hypothetical protein WL40_33795 [Burkholderia ubonensis]|uniref:FUSC family protein n=1 Tax=Burkholderia ubonensis TaxID=101571 RepID=UPI00075342C5|nr:FUSC family protein [Burkholderia ubonensis]KVP52924.1 hypothetical protein WJ92_16840 [Burkholderia ubonensis]KWB77144.1 hypothetical protein WL40_33795 [Burkholderia ubonensis]
MHAAASRRISRAVDTASLVRALAVTITPVALHATTGDPNWLLVVLASISLLIGIERAGLAPLGVLAQAVAIHAGFLLLSLSWTWKPAFVMGCAALAAAAVALSLAGSRLRSLGNFVFIPSLYLACEMSQARANTWALVPYLTVSALPPLALSCADALRDEGGHLRLLIRWRKPTDLGAPSGRADTACAIIAVTMSVALAATLVAWRRLPYGQWAIWSAASVVTVDAGLAKAKLRDRGIGVLIGVPAGLVAGLLLFRCTLAYSLLALVTPVTLIAFRHYTTGFAVRCACIACASWVTQQSLAAATDRIVDVILGGVVGVACVIAMDRAAHPPRQAVNGCRVNATRLPADDDGSRMLKRPCQVPGADTGNARPRAPASRRSSR